MFSFGGPPSTLYPVSSQPWSATPVQTNPNYTFATPGIAPSAQEINWLFYSLGQAAATGVTVPGCSWKSASTFSGTGYVPTGAHWDTLKFQWLICGSASSGTGACDVYLAQGLGDDTYASSVSSGGASPGKATSAIWDGTHYFMGVITAAGVFTVYRCSPGGAWASVLTDNTDTYTDISYFEIHGTDIIAYVAGGLGMYVYNAVVGAGAFGGWFGGLQNLQNSGSFLLKATNGTTWVVFAGYSGATTYMTATNPAGASWTPHSATFLGIAGVYGLVWSPADSKFLLVSTTGSAMQVYQSTDGIAWTLFSTTTTITTPRSMSATTSGCLVVGYTLGAAGDALAYSIDAGQTWHQSKATLAQPGGSLLTFMKVRGDGVGFVMLNNGTKVRFSDSAGLSPTLP